MSLCPSVNFGHATLDPKLLRQTAPKDLHHHRPDDGRSLRPDYADVAGKNARAAQGSPTQGVLFWGGFPKLGVPCWGSNIKDYSNLGSILGSPLVS